MTMARILWGHHFKLFDGIGKKFAQDQNRHCSATLHSGRKLKGASIIHNVKDDSVIGGIRLVAMLEPFCNTTVNLDITGKNGPANSDSRTAKIRSSVIVRCSGLKDFDWSSFGCNETDGTETLQLPNVMKY